MKRLSTTLLYILLTVVVASAATLPDMKFRRLDTRDGLSNSQINCIFKDSHGYVWIGTTYGLNRYDGYRFKNFYSNMRDTTTLRDNYIDQIQEAYDGKLWIKQGMNYCVYNPKTESFDRNPAGLLAKMGIKGSVDNLYIDGKKNFWVKLWNDGIAIYNPKTKKLTKIGQGYDENEINPTYGISTFQDLGDNVVFTTNCGELVCIDGENGKILWEDKWMREHDGPENQTYNLRVDAQGNMWVPTLNHTFIYIKREKKWYTSLPQYLKEHGVENVPENLMVWDILIDKHGWGWAATDHDGIIVFDVKSKEMRQFLNNKFDETTISDNTTKKLYQDQQGHMWIGTYRNGVNQYREGLSSFMNLEVGDINVALEDQKGNYWLGTNDKGIIVYNPKTDEQVNYTTANSGLSSNIMVGGHVASDGSVWFGSYNGGLVRCIPNGEGMSAQIINYRATGDTLGLANNNVWGVIEDKWHRIWIGTLGSGVQMLDLKTGKFRTWDTKNSKLPSDYTTTLWWTKKGWLMVGTSQYYSLINPTTGQVVNRVIPEDEHIPVSTAITTCVIEDSRGLLWQGSTSGVCVYDEQRKQVTLLDMTKGLYGSGICSITEDKRHNMWVVTDHGVSSIIPQLQEDGTWQFIVRSFNSRDGLQQGTYNYRSNCLTKSGLVLVGGQGGVGIIDPNRLTNNDSKEMPMFSGLLIYDRDVAVGEKVDGHVILDAPLNVSHELVLRYSESNFTVQLGSDGGLVQNHKRFVYKLEGFNDVWVKTSELNPNITYMSLRPGSYTLRVRMLNDDGTIGDTENYLEITIRPPLWRTRWAILLYVLAVLAAALWWRRRFLRRQAEKMQIEAVRRDVEKNQMLNEMKMKFYGNVSHELRTPLTHIISPLRQMLKQESDETKKKQLGMAEENAEKLLSMVNQILDFRKTEETSHTLNSQMGDIVAFVKKAVSAFSAVDDKDIELSFMTQVDEQQMMFDGEKMETVVNNLLTNAFKFTPNGGKVGVTMKKQDNGQLEICVADTGIGIKDEYKAHIFDRFYEGDHRSQEEGKDDSGSEEFGSNGIGLNLVKDYVELHGGTVIVEDNPGGGTVFVIHLPIGTGSDQPVEEDTILTTAADDGFAEYVEVEEVTDSSAADGQDKGDVLIVDDSQEFLDFMTELLGEHFSVRTASNGREALERMGEKLPDIVLTDVMMPEMDGNELCKAIKQNPQTASIPVVMLTARVADEQKMEHFENGADDYLTKPFNIDLLSLRISRLIKRKVQKIVPQIKDVQITSPDEKVVKDATDYVEDNLSNTYITVDTMANHLGMSRIHLGKKMLSLTGQTPSEFIRQIRLRHAEQLLRQSQMTVAEVAYQVGFDNPRYFSKYFSEMFGVMPSEYKESITKNKNE